MFVLKKTNQVIKDRKLIWKSIDVFRNLTRLFLLLV